MHGSFRCRHSSSWEYAFAVCGVASKAIIAGVVECNMGVSIVRWIAMCVVGLLGWVMSMHACYRYVSFAQVSPDWRCLYIAGCPLLDLGRQEVNVLMGMYET